MKRKLKEQLESIKPINFVWLLVAGVINACGVMLFLYPVKLYDSGISGTSMFLERIFSTFTSITLPMAIFLILINVPIFIFGHKKQGLTFTIYSLFTIAIYSLFSFLFSNVFPIDLSTASPLAGEDVLLCAIFGGVLSGIGSGLTIRFGGALDGMEVLSVIFAKKIGISIGTFVMIFNAFLYIVCGIVFQSWQLPLYSFITYFVGSKTVDFVVEGFDRSKCAMIVTTKANDISKALSENFQSSGTITNAIGGYTKKEKQIIYFVINHFQINKMKKIVHSIDKEAFISLHDVSDVIRQKD